MSLLMDALKRAEESKRQNAGASAGGAAETTPDKVELELEPPSPLPELASRLAEVDAEIEAFASESAAAAASPATARPAAGRQEKAAPLAEQAAARNVFAAKGDVRQLPTLRQRIIVIVAIGTLMGAGLGGYYYYQYQQLSGSGLRLATLPPVPTPPAAPTNTQPIIAGSAPATASPPAAAASPEAAPAATGQRPPEAAPSAAARPVRRSAPAEGARGSLASPPAATLHALDSPVRITTAAPKLNPALAKGHQSLQAGDLVAARQAFERALRGDPRNVDALNALAAIAVAGGQPERAQALYAQALEADPRNAAALAGLLGLRPAGDPAQAESRLKSALAAVADDPGQSAAVHFALGNLYAAQRRWNEAQHAYFQAYAADGGNPDYHYNLAVSLDHLQQTRLAVQFYRSALAAADARPAAFDRTQIEARLADLQR